MPNFTNPFPGMKGEGELNNEEIIRALRLDIAAEQDATHIYTAQAFRIRNPVVKNSLLDIAREERIHSGELMRLISEMDVNEVTLLAKGFSEVEERGNLEHHLLLEMMVAELKAR